MKETIILDGEKTTLEDLDKKPDYTGLILAVLCLVAAIGFVIYLNNKNDVEK